MAVLRNPSIPRPFGGGRRGALILIVLTLYTMSDESKNPLFALEQYFLTDTAGLGEFLLGDQSANDFLSKHKPRVIELGLSMVEARCVLLSVSASLIFEIVEDYENQPDPNAM